MSEQAPRSHETQKSSHETIDIPRNHEKHPKSSEIEPSLSAEKARENLESIRHEVAEKATSKEDVVVDTSEKDTFKASQPLINKELKDAMLVRTLSRIQKQLKPTERTFSKIVHNKPIDKVSTIGEKTIARPYGILGGALLAFLGSIFSTFLSKQFGLNYNLILFTLLFATGYILAICIEGIIRLAVRSK